jgi:hypothetical protein
MRRSELRIAMLGCKLVCALDGLLRFYSEFVPTDCHGCQSSIAMSFHAQQRRLTLSLGNAKGISLRADDTFNSIFHGAIVYKIKTGDAVSRLPLSLRPAGFCRAGRTNASVPTWFVSAHRFVPTYAALPTLLGSLPSTVFSLPTFTLICFGLASCFLASFTFKTPLS